MELAFTRVKNEAHSLTIYTAEPGTADEDRLKLLASRTAIGARQHGTSAARTPHQSPETRSSR